MVVWADKPTLVTPVRLERLTSSQRRWGATNGVAKPQGVWRSFDTGIPASAASFWFWFWLIVRTRSPESIVPVLLYVVAEQND